MFRPEYKHFISFDSDTEKRIIKSYYDIFIKSFRFDDASRKPVKYIVESRKELTTLKTKENFESYQYVYLLQDGLQDTYMSLRKFYDSTQKYTKIIQRLLSKTKIRFFCMGISSFFSAIGICEVINTVLVQFGFLDDNRTEIKLFLIDNNDGWKSQCEYIVSCINSNYVKIELKLVFLQATMSKAFSDVVELALQKAHFVIMSKCLSEFSSSKRSDKKLQIWKHMLFQLSEKQFLNIFNSIKKNLAIVYIFKLNRMVLPSTFLKEIMKNMKKNAVFFYLDTMSDMNLDNAKSLITKDRNFSEIEISEEEILPLKQIKTEQPDFYKSIFPLPTNSDFSNIVCSISIKSAGVKLETEPERDQSEEKKDTAVVHTANKHKKRPRSYYKKVAKSKSVSRYASFDDDEDFIEF